MEIMIDIDDDLYKSVVNNDAYVLEDVDWILLENAIANSTPLPKGHGDLKDADRLLGSFYEYCKNGDFGYHQAEDLIKSSLTIIGADGGGGRCSW